MGSYSISIAPASLAQTSGIAGDVAPPLRAFIPLLGRQQNASRGHIEHSLPALPKERRLEPHGVRALPAEAAVAGNRRRPPAKVYNGAKASTGVGTSWTPCVLWSLKKAG
jgi:hypothetical protein